LICVYFNKCFNSRYKMTHGVIVLNHVQKDRFVTNAQKLNQHYLKSIS